MKQPFELSSFMAKYTCRNMVQKFEGWNVVYMYYTFKRGASYI